VPTAIRPATLADVDVLVRGNCEMARETESIALDEPTVRAGVRRVLETKDKGRYFVVVADGVAVAQLMITFEWSDWRCGDVWWIQSVYVEPSHRKRGMFRLLYEHVVEVAKAEGARGVRLYVDLRNTGAQAVYRALGMSGDHYKVFEAMFDEPPAVG